MIRKLARVEIRRWAAVLTWNGYWMHIHAKSIAPEQITLSYTLRNLAEIVPDKFIPELKLKPSQCLDPITDQVFDSLEQVIPPRVVLRLVSIDYPGRLIEFELIRVE